jgi:hypothetical protein
MEKNRMEAFSDGVIAIIITIMVLEMKEPVDCERPVRPGRPDLAHSRPPHRAPGGQARKRMMPTRV